MTRFTTLATTAALAAATLGMAQIASANEIHFQGFETDSANWIPSNGITRVQSSGGTLSVPSSSGSYHAEITEGGSFDGGYTDFGDNDFSYNGPVVQSLDIYIDLGWADPTNGGNGFKMSMAATGTNGSYISDAAEQFLFSFEDDGDLNIEANGLGGNGSSITNLTSSGWYTFQATFRKGTDGFIDTVLGVYDDSGTLLGTQTRGGGANSLLGGHGYIWVNNWQDGFANDTLAIDNARAFVASVSVPEPASLGLLGIGAGMVLMMLMMRRTRRRDPR